jgi:hypothetical protein
MQAGRIWRCDRYQLRVSAVVSLGGVVTPADGAGATVETSWAPDLATVQTGIRLTAGRKGVQRRYIRLEIPALSVDTGALYGSAGNGSVEALLEIDSLALHLTGPEAAPLWRLSWSAMRLYLDGAQAWSSGAGVYSDPLTCGRIAPSGIPLLGIPPTLSASCQALMPSAPACSIPIGSADLYADAGPHTAQATGGWRFRPGPTDPWVELPVDLTVVSPPAPAGCQCPIPTLAIPSATTTWDCQVSAACGGTGGTSFSGYNRWCSVTLLPSLPRRFDLFKPGEYAALWVRGGFPRARVAGTATGHRCQGLAQPVSDCSATEYAERLAAQSTMLSTVVWTEDPDHPGQRLRHPIEDPLSAPIKAPYTLESSVYTTAPWPSDCAVVRSSVWPTIDQTADVLPALRHQTSGLATFVDTWANPHWSYAYWFPPPPPKPDDPIQPWEWPVDGARVSSDAYWVPLRVQWLHHPALPSGEDRRSRTTLLSACVDGALSRVFQERYVAGSRSHWVGVCRAETVRPAPPAYVRHDAGGASAWSATGAALSFGGTTVTVGYDGSNTGTRVVELDLQRYAGQRWMVPIWALALIGLYWPSTLVREVRVLLEGADGSRTELYRGKSPPSSALAPPAGPSAKYSGSWARDGGAGVVTDLGADLAPDGLSAAHMADPERSAGSALGTGRQWSKLRFEIDPASPTGAVHLSTPVLYRPGGGWLLMAETQGMQTILWPSRAHVRLGGRRWWDPTTQTVRETPQATPDALFRPTVLDALCELREIFEGADRLDQLDSRLSSLFDSVEGQARADAASFCRALWIPAPSRACPDLLAIDEWREVPALASFPLFDGSAWSQVQRDWACEPRWLAQPTTDPSELRTVSGSDWLDETVAIAGWTVRRHRRPVDNSETGFRVWHRGQAIASVRPWWGWVYSPKTPPSGGEVHLCRDPRAGWVYGLWSREGGGIDLWRLSPLGVAEVFQVSSSGSQAQGVVLPGGRVLAVWTSSGTVHGAFSRTYGRTWGTPMAIAGGTNPAVAADERSGALYVSVWGSGAHRLYRSLDGGQTWQSMGAIVSAPEGRAGLELAPGRQGRLEFVYDDGGTVRRRVSTDRGASWVDG